MTTTPSAAYLAEDKSHTIWAPQIITFVLASISLPLRLLSRRLTGSKLGWDDYLILISYIFAIGLEVAFALMSALGVGKHVERVMMDNPNAVKIMLIAITPGEICYSCTICFSKFSVLAFYWRLFGVTNMRKVVIAVACVVTGWMISVAITSGVACIPLEALWNTLIKGKCIDLAKFYLIISYPNVITDWIMLLIPLRYVWKLQMPKSQKIMVTGILCVGSFVCVVSTIRLVVMSKIDLADITWGLTPVTIWTTVESYSAIFCANLPSLKPLYHYVTGTKGSSQGSADTPQVGPRSGAWGRQKKNKDNTMGFTTINDDETRLREDDQWAPTTTAYASNSMKTSSVNEIPLRDVESNKGICVTKNVAWDETKP